MTITAKNTGRTLTRLDLVPAENLRAWTRAEARTRLPGLVLGWGLADGPVGPLLLGWAAERLCWLGLARDAAATEALFRRDWAGANLARDDREAAARAPAALAPDAGMLPLLLLGTAFQLRVWRALLAIPWGRVASYATVAAAVGCSRGFQAVGGAVGANPVAIAVPCHRVVGSNGHLHGFAWGLEAKQALLAREWDDADS